MRIVCDFGALVSQNVYLVRFFNTLFHNGIVRALRGDFIVDSLPIDSEILSVLVTNFSNHTVVINTPKQYEEDGRKIAEFLSSGDLPLKFVSLVSDINFENVDVYVSDSLLNLSFKCYKNTRIFVGNMLSSCIFYLLFWGEKIVKNKYFYGLFTIFLSSFSVFFFVSLSYLYLSFMILNLKHLLLIQSFNISIVFCMFFKILRDLMHVVDEWNTYTNGFHPINSWGYINGSNSMCVGVFYLLLSFVLCIVFSALFPIQSLISIFIGLLYFAVYNYRWYVRGLFAIGLGGIIWSIFNYAL